MKRCPQKKYKFPQKNWISLLNSAGIQQKTASVPAYNNLYHYAGNNPVRYIDPDGRLTKKEEQKRNDLFAHILSFVTEWIPDSRHNNTSTGPRDYLIAVGNISEEGIAYLKSISTEACTAGAIAVRNKYRDIKIPVIQLAINLKNNFSVKSFYRYGDNDYRTHGQIITDRNELFDKLQIGDILIYTNPSNPNGERGVWTGHTATIIGKGDEYVITLEFHEDGKDPTIQALSKNSLQNFEDTELYGGAKWE